MSKGKFSFMLENYKEQGLKKVFSLDEGWDEMMAAVKKKHKEEKGTGTFDKKKVSTGTVYTKKVNKDGTSKMKEEVELEEELKGKQHKIDKNKNGKIDAEDFKILRKEEDELEDEEVEQIEERAMTDAEKDKREDIVKGMKKSTQGFKERYGDKAKSVMYATATKQAMKD